MLTSRVTLASRPILGACQRRAFSATVRQASKVTVLGGAGGIGQPLSLLMKLNPRVTELALYDIKGGPGVAADIGHINTKSVVTGYQPDADGLKQALTGAEIVLIPAGVPRKPGMTRDDLFNTNASIVRDLAKAVADAAPDANILVIANPVNSTVPICAEIFKSKGVYNPRRLFGVTTLDVVRASRFISQYKSTDPADENITVVGGHSGATIVPLLSQSGYGLEGKDLDEFVFRVQFGGDEVVKAKDGAGSATLSMAMAGARFAESLLKAAQGEKGVVEPTFVDSPLYKDQGIDFFASKVELGPNGVEKIHEVGKITPKEQELLDACLKDLKKNIDKGVEFVKSNPSSLDHATDYENDIILLTCANGKQCNQLIPFLLPKWKNLRLAVSSDSSRQQLLEKYAGKSKAHVEVVLADIAQPNDCKGILDGVAAVYHVGPSSHTRETEIGYHMIEAAVVNNIKHFIYSSVLHPSLRKLLNHDCKR
ncbi:MAG: Malate dehydrogenase, cytoplasmic [Alectoria sarmentosa]|nr:MAG: Malate dehydrogenase, cytoplasmic [Alectoria sarmentosa]